MSSDKKMFIHRGMSVCDNSVSVSQPKDFKAGDALSTLAESMKESSLRHNSFVLQSREILSRSIVLLVVLHNDGSTDSQMTESTEAMEVEESLKQMLESIPGCDIHCRNLVSAAVEKFVTYQLLYIFFHKGVLAPPHEVISCSDEEYIGSCIGFSHELLQFSISRGAMGDIEMVTHCLTLVEKLSESLGRFEFRNSPLRRRYDSLKYVVKKITDMTYELGVALELRDCSKAHVTLTETNSAGDIMEVEADRPVKKSRIVQSGEGDAKDEKDSSASLLGVEESFVLVPLDSLDAVRERMDEFDRKREEVIKTCRDAQKLAKQSIYAIHRALKQSTPKFNEAEQKLKSCVGIFISLWGRLIDPTSPLRLGSFSACMEEFLEGLLLLRWSQDRVLLSKSECLAYICDAVSSMKTNSNDVILKSIDNLSSQSELMESMNVLDLEYVGALSDLTGELGRIAVFAAIGRDRSTVDQVLNVDTAVVHALTRVNSNVSVSKKVDAVLANRRKVQELKYDLACLSLSGGARSQRPPTSAKEPMCMNTSELLGMESGEGYRDDSEI